MESISLIPLSPNQAWPMNDNVIPNPCTEIIVQPAADLTESGISINLSVTTPTISEILIMGSNKASVNKALI